MATINKFLKNLTLTEVNEISLEFLKGFTDLGKKYTFNLKGFNNKREWFGLEPITKNDSVNYRINYLKSNYTVEEIETELFNFLRNVRISEARWAGFDLFGIHFNARDYVRILKNTIGSSNYKKVSEKARLMKIEETDMALYGGIGYGSEDIKQNIIKTTTEIYGVDNVMKNKDVRKDFVSPFSDPKIRHKAMSSKISNVRELILLVKKTGDFSKAPIKSSFELTVFKKLVEKYGFDDVFYEYGFHPYDERYPYNCDFYVKSLDLFIELNLYPSHGGGWYMDTHDDKLRLEHLKSSPKKMSKETIVTWAKRDIEKRKLAKKNNLNYLVFWNNDLSDFFIWYDDYNCDYFKFVKDFKQNTYC